MSKLEKLLISLLILCSCSKQQEIIFHNYDEIRNSQISWENIFINEDDDFFVYFYAEKCGYCNEIKQSVLNFYLKNLVTWYFVNCDYEIRIGPTKDLTGIDNSDDFYIFGTPFLIRLQYQVVTDYYVGSQQILDYISILSKN